MVIYLDTYTFDELKDFLQINNKIHDLEKGQIILKTKFESFDKFKEEQGIINKDTCNTISDLEKTVLKLDGTVISFNTAVNTLSVAMSKINEGNNLNISDMIKKIIPWLIAAGFGAMNLFEKVK